MGQRALRALLMQRAGFDPATARLLSPAAPTMDTVAKILNSGEPPMYGGAPEKMSLFRKGTPDQAGLAVKLAA